MSQKVLMLKGLPACGKSTYARKLVKEKDPSSLKWRRVNKDDLRAMIANGLWSSVDEKIVLNIRNSIIVELLLKGFNVIVDDTNLNPIHERDILNLIKIFNETRTEENKVLFEIKSFLDVPIEVCIERDKNRPEPVGEKVIFDMVNKFLKPSNKSQKKQNDFSHFKDHRIELLNKRQNSPALDAIICDIDGTLALNSGRNPFDFSKVYDDDVNDPLLSILKKYLHSSIDAFPKPRKTEIVFVSGRDDSCLEETKRWLIEKCLLLDFKLLMRRTGDKRADTVVKKEIYETRIRDFYNVLFVFDDRPSVIRMWERECGLPVFNVNPTGPEF